MTVLLYSLISAFIIAIISIIGIITLSLSDKLVQKALLLLVSLSAGTLIGGAFLHLIPAAFEGVENLIIPSTYILTGFGLFFIMEKVLRWHHCHKFDCDVHQHLGQINIIGDSVHNFIDGLVIVSAFSVSPAMGISVALAIAMHEIPQEIGDYGVLRYSGWAKNKALFYNFMAALAVVVGVVLGYFLISKIGGIIAFLLPFAAGGFIYIAASDLVPELHKETNLGKSLLSFLVFLLGLGLMFGLLFVG